MSRTFVELGRRLSPAVRRSNSLVRTARRSNSRHGAVRGAVAGLVATVLMTGVIGGGQLLGLLRTPPPVHITAKLARRAGVQPNEDRGSFNVLWMTAHGAYGAACGVGYVVVRPALPRSPLLAGLICGGVIWSASYFALMPTLGLYPWPEDDRNSRLGVMGLAHAVFGVSLAEVEHLLAHRA